VARAALATIAISLTLTVAIGLLGPSAMVPALPGPAWQPPYSLGLAPGPRLAIALAAADLLCGAAGLLCGLLALRRGWAPNARTLLVAGCLVVAALALLPPSGSADHLNYAAYGRIAALGHDPYVTTAADLPGDPIARAVEEWRTTPSVYGPVATALQALASLAGGTSVRLTVFVLAAVNAAAYIGTALLLHRSTPPPHRARAALLWAANPLTIYQLAAGMHVDTLAILCATAALTLTLTSGLRAPFHSTKRAPRPGHPAPMPDPSDPAPQPIPALFQHPSQWHRSQRRPSRWHPLVRWPGTGVLLGLAVAIKINAGLVALGPAWALRRAPRKLALVAGVALATAATAYALAGPHAFDRVSQATKSISLATPWSLVRSWLQTALGPGGYRSWIQAGSLLLLLALAWLLIRALRTPYATPRPTPDAEATTPEETPPTTASRGATTMAQPGETSAGPQSHPPGTADRPGQVSAGPQAHPPENTALPGETSTPAGPVSATAADRHGPAPEKVAAAYRAAHEDAPSPVHRTASSTSASVVSASSTSAFATSASVMSARPRTPDLAAAGVAAIVVTAWLFAAPYALPWYDGLAFALLALLPATPLDGFLAARLSLLSLAYLPAREAGRPADLDWLLTVVRAQIVPWALLALTAALAWWAWHASRRSL
jgi:hypothetical protein